MHKRPDIRLPDVEEDLTVLFMQEATALNAEIIPCSRETLQKVLNDAGVDLSTAVADADAAAILNDSRVSTYSPGLTHARMDQYTAGISCPDAGIAKTGTLVELSEQDGDRRISLLPDTHVAILPGSKLLPDLQAWLKRNGDLNQATFISGPSRTADIEKRIVIGAHGPKRLIILLLG